MKTPLLLLLCLALLPLAGCYREPVIEGQYADEYYLRHLDADLPVWVRGNRSSRSFIIFLHGGPGGSAMIDVLSRSLRDVTDAHPVVFYDQRLSGFAHGRRNLDQMSLDQMTEDLNQVIQFVEATYQPESIFLMGHSWGGYLGTAYLLDSLRQQRISGWIEVAGAHNFQLTWQAEIEYVTPIAQQRIAAGEDTAKWQSFLRWVEEHPEISSLEDLLYVNQHAHSVDGKPDTEAAYEFPATFWALTSPFPPTSSQALILEGLEDLLLSPGFDAEMARIRTPALLLYGAYDAVVPKALAQHAWDHLGTPDADKRIFIMPQEGHSMWEIEPQLFAQQVRAFIEAYE